MKFGAMNVSREPLPSQGALDSTFFLPLAIVPSVKFGCSPINGPSMSVGAVYLRFALDPLRV